MNVHDSEKIAGIFSESGYEDVKGAGDADIVVLNTCSIREKAEQKFTSELGRLKKFKKQNPGLKIAVAGCIAQQRGEKLLKRFPYVDFLFGPDNINNFQNWVKNGNSSKSALLENPDYHRTELPFKREGQVKAWVSIMYGCDNFCAYCVVPYTRGRERSRPVEDIYAEIQVLADQGFKEVTLLGQNVNSFGKGLPGEKDFPDLLKRIHEIDGMQRIRFVTSHPRDFSEKLIQAMVDLPKVCNHLHLPIQSGSDRILRLMNRGYSYCEYREKIQIIRSYINNISVTSDIIVGFPGESDEDYERTVHALTELEYDGIYAFKYSRRPDTKALTLPDHVDEADKSERLSQIIQLQDSITLKKNRALIGREFEILVEGVSASDPERLTGRTETNKIVNFTGQNADIGKIVSVQITEAKMHSLLGERI